MLAEDFNIVRWPSKTNAKSLDKKNMTILNNIIQDFGLVDPPLSNNSYTWSNLKTDPIYSRLDRFLYTKDWESTFKVHHSKTMQRTVSDHFPITLESHHITWGPCPFRLNNASLNEKDFTKNFPTWIYSSKQRKNLIKEITDSNGQVYDTTDGISNVITNHFKGLFKKKESIEILISNLEWNPLNDIHQSNLCKTFDEAEIKRTIWSLSNDKAPGPDGFPILFYKKHWHTLKKDLIEVFKEFHGNCVNKCVNNTYIALIGKKNLYSKLTDFRPISLTTSLYKIMVKTLANKIKETLPDTVAKNQMAFVKGRQITDAILIANEVIDYWKSKKEKGFILKLDVEKAFDKISSSFIEYMLNQKNYLERLRKWIKACISNVNYSVIINGKPRGRIKAQKGIKQGDSISPFIFVLAMDYLSRLLNHLKKRQAIKGAKINNSCSITHLLFVDDILIFVEDDDVSIKNLQTAPMLFELAFGLKINLLKSTRYHREPEALWKSIIDAKYSKTFTGGIPEFGKYSSSNASWRSIIKGKDCISLNQKAPRLYALSSCKEATVKEVWDPGINDWNFKPRRPLNERESNAWQLLKNSLPTITQNSTDDRPVWNKESNDTYTTRSAKKAFLEEAHHSQLPQSTQSLGYKNLWGSTMPLKCYSPAHVTSPGNFYYFGFNEILLWLPKNTITKYP
ncbi:LINE-1 retrotransposable element ORF2 protein [Cucumis melo var. makuwa]|uniref:LINE-1 retrotransposable element ORF2 protein n=1 Tax=Cucumis melo var. makuwa TaxID=1194695 RepID=A0A5A7TYF4_CUCMM|nr:LINE-1 retrotransposable element ORF2 protein [Cucumis melo var. makuwa]